MEELREKIAKLYLARWSSGCTEEDFPKVYKDGLQFADQILAIIKEAGYFQEEAEWIGRLLRRGWIPPVEAKLKE